MNPGRSLIDKLVANPIPTAMVGIGLILMIRNSSSTGEMQEIDDVAYDPTYGEGEASSMNAASATPGRIDAVRERVSGALSVVGERASGGIDRVRTSGEDLMSSNPLIMGVAAIAFGALVGALIPETEREHRLFGEHRDNLINRGRDLAREGVDRAKNVASTVVDRAKDAALDVASAAKDAATNSSARA